LVSHFIFDEHAQTTGASYVPSEELGIAVNQAERAGGGLELKGILHSHPGGMNHPSTTDLASFESYLVSNPHLDDLAVVICTFAREALRSNEIQLGDLRYSLFRAFRTGSGTALLRAEKPRVLPIEGLQRVLVDVLGADWSASGTEAMVTDGTGALLFQLEKEGRPQAIVVVPESYPGMAPVVHIELDTGATTTVALPWSWGMSFDARVNEYAHALAAAFLNRDSALLPDPQLGTVQLPGTPSRPPNGSVSPPPSVSVSGQPDLKWSYRSFRELLRPALESVMDRNGRAATRRLLARSQGILDSQIRTERVLILGCGSVGSTAASLLARSGVGNFILIDPERVARENVGRSIYEVRDVGRFKVNALHAALKRINPSVSVTVIDRDFQELSAPWLQSVVESATVVFGAADDHKAMCRLSHFSYRLGIPGVFVGIYSRAKGGEIIVSLPPHQVCYSCAVRTRVGLEPETGDLGAREVDYGTGRLVAEPGLYADVSTVSSFAAKILLAVTPSLPEESALSTDFQRPISASGGTFSLVGVSPGFAFFGEPGALGSAPNQLAFQSIWMRPYRYDDCSTCGTSPSGLHDSAEPALDVLRALVSGE
jgi:molybdopterin/thiamine biosynthesis adenylyltransferase